MQIGKWIPASIGLGTCALTLSIALAAPTTVPSSTTKPTTAPAGAVKAKPKLTPTEMKNTKLIICEPQAFAFRVPEEWEVSQMNPSQGRYEYFMTEPAKKPKPDTSPKGQANRPPAPPSLLGGSQSSNGAGLEPLSIGVSFEMVAGTPCHGEPTIESQCDSLRARTKDTKVIKDEPTTLDGRPAHLLEIEFSGTGSIVEGKTGRVKQIVVKNREHHIVAVIDKKAYDIWYSGAAENCVKAVAGFDRVVRSFAFTADPTTRPAAAE